MGVTNSAPGFTTLTDEVAALRVQVQESGTLIQHLEAKIAWLTRMVYGAKREWRPVEQELGAAQQENFLVAPVTAVAIDPDAAQATAEQQAAQAITVLMASKLYRC